MDPFITTYTGQKFYFSRPEECLFTLSDIAMPLSQINRLTGHTKRPYSVAEHSLLASFWAPDDLRYAVLMHDAAEAFLGDVAYPLKKLLPDYQAIEERVEKAVFARLGVPSPLPPEVDTWDKRALVTERKFLLHDQDTVWEEFKHLEPYDVTTMSTWDLGTLQKVFCDVFRLLAPSQVVATVSDHSVKPLIAPA